MKHLCFLILLCCTILAGPLHAEKIDWQPWKKQVFEQARTDKRMILLDVGIEGCTACRWMDEITYTDASVIRLVNNHFVAIAVDAEAQPDIGERYSDWAWPATIFMSPDAVQVLALSGNRRPKNFIPLLEELIRKQAANQLEADQLAPYAAAPAPETTDMTRIRDSVRGQLDALLNKRQGGWQRRGISTAGGARLEHLFLRSHMYSDAALLNVALLTTDGYVRAMDPVWGGVFVQSFHDDENQPERFRGLAAVPEKRISNQANALLAFSHAYKTTREPAYLQAMEDVDRFLRDWMMHEDGSWYTSQEDDPPGLAKDMDAIDYWSLDNDADRRRYGVPPVDHAVYTDKNAQVIMAYAAAYEATGKTAWRDSALRAARALIASRLQDEGWIMQASNSAKVSKDKRMRPLTLESRPFLSAQAWFGSALLALYRVTGEAQWLEQARQVADAMLSHLYDKDTGGFYASLDDETAAIMPPRKPLELNARAAHFFYDLWIFTKKDDYAKIPEQTLRAVALPAILEREGRIVGETALALEKLTAAYVEFSVVGEQADPATLALFEAGRNTYHPRKLLHYEQAGRYPMRKEAAMYICNPDRCSIPIYDPALVARQADSFRLPAGFSP